MAKGGAAKGPSKKTVDKAKQKTIEDKTFGLKNKSKSKKVQKHVTEVKKAVHQVHDKKTKKEMEEREKKRLLKLEQKKREEELKALFKSADPEKKDEVKDETNEEEDGEEALFDQIEQELADEEEMTLEDIIEKERAKIISGTQVTYESFMKWKQFKIEQQQKEEERRKKAARESGTLTGRDLFEYNQSLFIDDDAAGGAEDYAKEDDVDSSLFLDDENEEEEKEVIPSEYDPQSWKDSKTPKEKLQDFFNNKRWPLPKYECIPAPQGFSGRIITAHDKREFATPQSYANKKLAEQNVALVAYAHYANTK